MKSPIQRRTAIAALLLAPVLGACGFSAQTDQVYQAANGVNDRSGTVDILNAQVVSAEKGVGTFAGTLVNGSTTKRTLVSISGTGITTVQGSYAIPARGVLDLADPATDGGPQLVIKGADVAPGGYVKVTFEFADGQTTTVKMPVFSNTVDYQDVPLPSATPTDDATDDATGSGDSE
ncbi:MAG: hypothetical protein ACJ72D_09330 [Marmoricola sp.]